MSIERKIRQRSAKRKLRVRAHLVRADRPRASVFRSLQNISCQIIDDQQQKTLLSYSSLQLKDKKGDKKAVARQVGLELARLAREQGVSRIIFDRGNFLYHGRVKALAEGLREGGLEF